MKTRPEQTPERPEARPQARPYVQRARAEKAAETADRVIEAAERLFARDLFDRVTLDAIAREAGVSIPTLQRRHGSKEGVFWAVVERAQARVAAQRAEPVLGDLDLNLGRLVAHYELEGRVMWHLLRQEADSAIVAQVLDSARGVHRQWVEAAFGKGTRERTDALVAATDLFIWKLLRVDLGRSAKAVQAVMRRLVEGALTEAT